MNAIDVGLVSIGNIVTKSAQKLEDLLFGIELMVSGRHSFCSALLEAVDEAFTK